MRMFSRRCTLALVLILILLLHTGPSHGDDQLRLEPLKLKVVILPYLVYAPFFIAQEEGYFAEQGLEVEFVKMNKSSTAVAALIQGQLDVVPGTIWTSQLNAITRGARMKFVASRSYVATTGCTSAAIIARRTLVEDGILDDPAQLRGLRISVNPACYMGYFVEKLLEQAGMSLDDMETVDLTPAVELEALRKGTLDITLIGEPWLTRILQDGHTVLWKPAREIVPDFQWNFILYGPTLLDQNPAAGKRFMVAYLKAVQQYNQGKTKRNAEILTKHTGLDEELLNSACWPTMSSDGHINFENVLEFQHWAMKKGLLDGLVTKEQFLDLSFIEYANQVLEKSAR